MLFALNLAIFFPVPILLALLLNEVRIALFKKFVQTLIYIPHFMSWVIVVSLSFVLLTVDGGLINELIVFLAVKNQFSAERRMVPAPVYSAGYLEGSGLVDDHLSGGHYSG